MCVVPSCFVFGSYLSNIIHYILFVNLFEKLYFCPFVVFFFKEDADFSSPIVQCRTQQVYLLVCMLNEMVEGCISPKWPERYFQSHIAFSNLGNHHQDEGPLFPFFLKLGWTLWLSQWIECSGNHIPWYLWYGFHVVHPLSFSFSKSSHPWTPSLYPERKTELSQIIHEDNYMKWFTCKRTEPLPPVDSSHQSPDMQVREPSGISGRQLQPTACFCK